MLLGYLPTSSGCYSQKSFRNQVKELKKDDVVGWEIGLLFIAYVSLVSVVLQSSPTENCNSAIGVQCAEMPWNFIVLVLVLMGLSM